MSQVATIPQEKVSLLAEMAGRYGMEPQKFAETLRATVVPADATNEEFAAFLMVAREYNLNPITKEIYAFPKRGGGIQPIVSVDGWANLINSHPKADGIEFKDTLNDRGDLIAITCSMFRKDRAHAVEATEYMAECKRDTATWKQWPRRMLRHKALIQAARYAFGFAGIVDDDEAERFTGDRAATVPPPAPPANAIPALSPPSPPVRTAPPKPVSAEVAQIIENSPQRPAEISNDDAVDLAVDLAKKLEAATKDDDLQEIWDSEIEPHFDKLSEPDQEFLQGKMREASARLAP